MDIRSKAMEMVNLCAEVTLASVSEQGFPRPCVLSKIKSEGLRKFWVSTGGNGVKTRHFRANPKAGASFLRGSDSITLIGEVSIVEDPIIKQSLWQDWFVNHFPGGATDPNYCVLMFTAIEATLWIDGEFVTLEADAL